MGKKLLWIGLIVLVVIGILIWRVVANLDGIVASVIEKEGSKALKTEVTVSGVELSLKEGKAAINGLTIANPEGYSSAPLFQLEGIEVSLDLQSMSGDVLIVDSIKSGNVAVSYELNADGSNNLQDLLDNIESGESSGSESSSGKQLLLIIDELAFAGATVNMQSAVEDTEDQEITIPSLDLAGIGRPDGATPGQVAGAVTGGLVSEILKETAKSGFRRAVEEKTEGLLDKFKNDD